MVTNLHGDEKNSVLNLSAIKKGHRSALAITNIGLLLLFTDTA
jgi:hypothetical protein